MSECYEWYTLTNMGYGRHRVQVDNRTRYWLVHRIVWAMAHGPIPDGCVVRHRCDNPACVRLDHLEVGTQSDNICDMWRRHRRTHHGQRLTDAQVADIRARVGYRGVARDLAREYGVTLGHISAIRLGNSRVSVQ